MRFVAAMWLSIAVAFAQAPRSTGTIQGNITDPSGAAIPAARIVAQNADTGARRSTQADASGQFTLPGLNVGMWALTIEAEGFAPARTEASQLSVGQILIRNIQLQPAGLVERLDVTETPDAVESAASTASVALGFERIEEAPARSRNYLNFVLSAPAVAPAAGSSSQRTMTGVRAPVPDTGFVFGGMRARNNSMQIDGMDNRDETTGANRVAIGLEMVQEFRVSSVTVGAELGGAAGGLLNMVTRSGVNLWHGDVTFFGQNEALNARRAEVDESLEPRFRRYQPGASGLGPLRRDRTFIAGAVEHERELADEFSNVPADLGLEAARGLYETSTRGTELSLKLDHQIGTRDSTSVRYAFSRGRVLHEVQGPENFAARSAQGSSLTTDHSLVGNWLRVVSPTLVNDVRAQFGERSMTLTPNGRGPMFEVPGVVTYGQYYRMDASRTERHYQLVEAFHFVIGSHRLAAGGDVHVVTLDGVFRDRFAGIYVFPTLKDFRNQRPDIFIQAFGDPRVRMTTAPASVWLQDRWQVSKGVLIEAGLRYDHQSMPEGLPESSHNLSPRLGLAWRPSANRPFVVRAGAGLFYDRYPLGWLKDALQKDGVRGYETYGVGGDVARPVQATWQASRHLPSTYSRKFSAGVEYGLDKVTTLTLEAAHIRGFHLPRTRNTAGGLPPVYLLEQTARSSYAGATIAVNRRLAKEVAWLASYTCGRTHDDGSDFDEQPMDPMNIRADWALSRQDQRHRVSASAVFEMPSGELSWLERITMAPILTAGSGRPINALLTTDAYRTGAYPVSARPAGLGRNPFRTKPAITLDVRVMKTIPMQEGRALLQFGVESFNVLNHTNPERVSQYFAADRERIRTYGEALENLPARQVQFLVQYEF
ncbi:MAG TPA: TonB-dependent receptor [Bryobacteraceae bacterium]|nr:TonB-dependent receptor [Bryobacteraceae bacterium]